MGFRTDKTVTVQNCGLQTEIVMEQMDTGYFQVTSRQRKLGEPVWLVTGDQIVDHTEALVLWGEWTVNTVTETFVWDTVKGPRLLDVDSVGQAAIDGAYREDQR